MRRFPRIVSNLVICFLLTLVSAKVAWSLPMPDEATVRELIPFASWQKQFKITEGKDRGRVVSLISRPDLSNEKRWKLIFGDYAAIHVVRGSDGGLVIERLDLIKNNSFIVYEPALPIMPADINSSDLMRSETGYKMYNLETGKLKRGGRVTHLLKPPSFSQVDTPAGLLDGYYVEIDHLMDMEYRSQLHLTMRLGYRVNEGLVNAAGHYTVTKLGVFTATKAAGAALFTR
jgi:hypothetical protein